MAYITATNGTGNKILKVFFGTLATALVVSIATPKVLMSDIEKTKLKKQKFIDSVAAAIAPDMLTMQGVTDDAVEYEKSLKQFQANHPEIIVEQFDVSTGPYVGETAKNVVFSAPYTNEKDTLFVAKFNY